MGRKRGKLEIYLDVLRAVAKGERLKTKIMYKCNLSWVPLTVVLESCLSQGLIHQDGKNYTITQKGLRALGYFNRARKRLDYSKTLP